MKVGAYEELPEDQQLAIELLVLGDPDMAGKPMKYNDIAEKCGVHPFTLRRWRAEPAFQEAKREFRERIKGDIVDEAIKTLRRSMRTKDSTHAAEIALKWAGEMIERRELTGSMTNKHEIDLKDADTVELLERIKQHQRQLGISEDGHSILSITASPIQDGEIIDENSG